VVVKAMNLKSGISFYDISGKLNHVKSVELPPFSDVAMLTLEGDVMVGVDANLEVRVLEN